MDAVQHERAQYLLIEDADYPQLLPQLDNAPPAITYRSDICQINKQSIAMVGARNASVGACQFARQLALGIGGQGLIVASGLARVIDTPAHVGSITCRKIGTWCRCKG